MSAPGRRAPLSYLPACLPACLLACLLAPALSACATTAAEVPIETVPLTPVEETQALLAAAAPSRWFEVRYNPCDCACPPFEVRLGDRWLRATVRPDADEPPTSLLLQTATDDLAEGRVPRYALIGSIDDGVQRCATNALVVRIDATEWSTEVPPPLPPIEEPPLPGDALEPESEPPP